MEKPFVIAIGSVVVGVVVLGLKYWAYLLTGSVALYSDALESIVNVVTALAALIAIRLADRPADPRLPYGYHKAEYVSAVIEGVFIVVAALLIFREAWSSFWAPTHLDAPLEGLAVNVGASILNALWCTVLIRKGRKLRSPALEADGRHLLTDVVSSVGVVAGLLLAMLTGWLVLDAVIAALVGVNVLYSGTKLLKSSLGGLMDVAVDEETMTAIRRIIAAHADGALEAHDLRARQAGRMIFVDFHLVVPGAMPVATAHEICDRIEAALAAEVADCQITIHVEPDAKAKHSGIVVL